MDHQDVHPMLLTKSAPPQHNLAALLAAMTQGIREHERLCALLLPRVAHEGSVVRLVFIEHQKKDLVLKEAERSFWFEFKYLWSNGFAECAGGILRDYEKLNRTPLADSPNERAAIAIAYTGDQPPKGYEIRRTRGLRCRLKIQPMNLVIG